MFEWEEGRGRILVNDLSTTTTKKTDRDMTRTGGANLQRMAHEERELDVLVRQRRDPRTIVEAENGLDFQAVRVVQVQHRYERPTLALQ